MNFQDGEDCGDCDGRFMGTRYFTASPKSSIFTTVDHLLPYLTEQNKRKPQPYFQKSDNCVYNKEIYPTKSVYFPSSYSKAVLKTNEAHSSFRNSNSRDSSDKKDQNKDYIQKNDKIDEHRSSLSNPLGKYRIFLYLFQGEL